MQVRLERTAQIHKNHPCLPVVGGNLKLTAKAALILTAAKQVNFSDCSDRFARHFRSFIILTEESVRVFPPRELLIMKECVNKRGRLEFFSFFSRPADL